MGPVSPTVDSSAQQISFSDDLFINHSHNRYPQNCAEVQTNPKTPYREQNVEVKNGRKHCEAFVMTGDAILNLSKNNSNDAFKASPTKTSSKLTPMPQMPVFVEREKDFERRLQLGRNLEKEMKDSCSNSTPGSPPLPPPPSELDCLRGDLSRQNSVDTKSENLPLPPFPTEVDDQCLLGSHQLPTQRNTDSAQNVHKNGSHQFAGVNGNNNKEFGGGSSEENSSNSDKVDACGQVKRSSNKHNCSNVNNEDTSISSSVMSDSGDDEDDQIALIETDEDGEEEFNRHGKEEDPLILKMAAKKSKMFHHKNGDHKNGRHTEPYVASEKVQIPEKERSVPYTTFINEIRIRYWFAFTQCDIVLLAYIFFCIL